MQLTRRAFLKTMLAGAAATQFPGLAFADTPAQIGHIDNFRFIESDLSQFAGDKRFGNMLAAVPGDEARDKSLQILKADIVKHLKFGTRYELLGNYPSDYGRTFSYAWYADLEIQTKPITGLLDKPELLKDRGVYLLGRGVIL